MGRVVLIFHPSARARKPLNLNPRPPNLHPQSSQLNPHTSSVNAKSLTLARLRRSKGESSFYFITLKPRVE